MNCMTFYVMSMSDFLIIREIYPVIYESNIGLGSD